MIMKKMTYKEAYEFGVSELEDVNIEDAKIDSRFLLEEICDTNRNDLYVHPDRILSEDERQKYLSWIKIRKNHIPLQHILGKQEFMGLEFRVNEHVLIPRQDTELLVEEALKHIHGGMRILDICTGSGCILISLLHYTNSCQGIGVDISEEALEVANDNAKRLNSTATFIESDLFDKVEGKFDVIVSNPPYIRSDVVDTLMPEVLEHEPRLALDGREDGLYFYRKIIKEAKTYAHAETYLLFEIGYDQGEAVSKLLEEEGYIEIQVLKDYAGLDRVVSAMVAW
jgi:release factor glutamine methyltransferase